MVYNSQKICLGDPLAAALPDGYIVLSKHAVEILYKNVSSIVGDTRTAFVLGHELAHLANDDHWHLEFYNLVRRNQSLRPLVNRFFEQNGEQIKQNLAYIKTMQSQISFTQTLLTVILGGVIVSPLVIMYFQRKDDKYAKKEIKDSIEITRNIVTALKELSEDDPKIQRSLRVAGIS